mmetsp:Transcript_38156/g.32280  ORF Transcript_38156/g.32280 Transcript_38156/m.32280 type:complete len:110 (-) Transcript_38156:111-440(-)
MVVILRRKFIPPLCDMGQDILIQASGLIGKDAEPSGKFDFVKLCMDTCHSVNTVTNINTSYLDLIQLKVDSLTMDEDAMTFILNYERLAPIDLNENSDDIWRLCIEFIS